MDGNDDIERHSSILKAMGNPKRLEILLLTSMAEWSVGDLARETNLSQSALSQHLAKLRQHQLVGCRRDGHTIYYSCPTKSVERIIAILNVDEG